MCAFDEIAEILYFSECPRGTRGRPLSAEGAKRAEAAGHAVCDKKTRAGRQVQYHDPRDTKGKEQRTSTRQKLRERIDKQRAEGKNLPGRKPKPKQEEKPKVKRKSQSKQPKRKTKGKPHSTMASEETIFQGLKEAQREYADSHSYFGQTADIPTMFDELKKKGLVEDLSQFHQLLRKWGKENKIFLETVDAPYLEPRANEGIKTDHGVLFYLRLKDTKEHKPEPETKENPKPKGDIDFGLMKAVHDEVHKRVPHTGGEINITQLRDEMEKRGINLPREAFQKLLGKWWDDGLVSLRVADNQSLMDDWRDGIDTPHGMLYYVHLTDKGKGQKNSELPKEKPAKIDGNFMRKKATRGRRNVRKYAPMFPVTLPQIYAQIKDELPGVSEKEFVDEMNKDIPSGHSGKKIEDSQVINEMESAHDRLQAHFRLSSAFDFRELFEETQEALPDLTERQFIENVKRLRREGKIDVDHTNDHIDDPIAINVPSGRQIFYLKWRK